MPPLWNALDCERTFLLSYQVPVSSAGCVSNRPPRKSLWSLLRLRIEGSMSFFEIDRSSLFNCCSCRSNCLWFKSSRNWGLRDAAILLTFLACAVVSSAVSSFYPTTILSSLLLIGV